MAKSKSASSTGAGRLSGKRVSVAIKKPDDRWSEFKLADGTTLKLRHLIVEVHRVNGQFAQDGQPIYEIKGGTLLEVSAPKTLRKKG